MAARVASDPQPVFHHIALVFLNVAACVGKEVNAKVTETETDALSMRVGLKSADRDGSNAAGENLVFCKLAHPCLGPRDRKQNLESDFPGATRPPTDRYGGCGLQPAQQAMKSHAIRN
jgi:hypothetical protein